jgi:hypothetical protein
LGDLTGFVVAADKGDSFWVSDLECKQEKEGFYAVKSSIYKIACGVQVDR